MRRLRKRPTEEETLADKEAVVRLAVYSLKLCRQAGCAASEDETGSVRPLGSKRLLRVRHNVLRNPLHAPGAHCLSHTADFATIRRRTSILPADIDFAGGL